MGWRISIEAEMPPGVRERERERGREKEKEKGKAQPVVGAVVEEPFPLRFLGRLTIPIIVRKDFDLRERERERGREGGKGQKLLREFRSEVDIGCHHQQDHSTKKSLVVIL